MPQPIQKTVVSPSKFIGGKANDPQKKQESISLDNAGTKARVMGHAAGAYSQASSALRAGASPLKGAATGVLKRAGPLMVAGAAIDAGMLATRPESRQQAKNEVEESAKSPALVRMAKGFLNPVNTAYGIAAQIGEAYKSTKSAKESQARYDAEIKRRAKKSVVSPPRFVKKNKAKP